MVSASAAFPCALQILKKHDKQLPHSPCRQFYIAHLHNQPWVQVCSPLYKCLLLFAGLSGAVRPLLLSLHAVLPHAVLRCAAVAALLACGAAPLRSDLLGSTKICCPAPPSHLPVHECCCVQGNYSDLLVSLSAVYSDLRGDAAPPQSEEGLEVRGLIVRGMVAVLHHPR